ncbi:C-type natriuretic peptide 1-like [Sceloporus undulatus]|uniref:C-type natriuretic peptide 1-like n=1 Tax=Sceloporus undulatus TaxID=8520 RepID=UPI001C4BAA63|nr:C-type natriuretic peptide 1-like [Sceloporus undulatus]
MRTVIFLFVVLLPAASLTPVHSPQAFLEILGEDLEALLSERDGDPLLLPQDSLTRLLGKQRPFLRGTPSGLPSASPPDEAWIHVLRDLLNTQKKFRGRTKKMMMGQQGCFGIKLDRIGTLSGLGC